MTALCIRRARIQEVVVLPSQRKGVCLVIVSAIVFGLNPLFAKQVFSGGGNAWTLTFLSKALGAVGLFLMHLLSAERLMPVSGRQFRHLLLCSLGATAAPTLLYSSYHFIPSGIATTLHFVYPVFVIAGCGLFFRERLERRQLFCCVLCMTGIACFYTPSQDVDLTGAVIALASGAAYAFYIVSLARSSLMEIPPYQLAAMLCLANALETLVISAVSGRLAFTLTAAAWGFALVFSLLNSCVATIAFQIGTKYIGPQNASLLSTFEPLTSVLVGIFLYHEALTAPSAAGICCILCSVVLLSLRRGRSAAETA